MAGRLFRVALGAMSALLILTGVHFGLRAAGDALAGNPTSTTAVAAGTTTPGVENSSTTGAVTLGTLPGTEVVEGANHVFLVASGAIEGEHELGGNWSFIEVNDDLQPLEAVKFSFGDSEGGDQMGIYLEGWDGLEESLGPDSEVTAMVKLGAGPFIADPGQCTLEVVDANKETASGDFFFMDNYAHELVGRVDLTGHLTCTDVEAMLGDGLVTFEALFRGVTELVVLTPQ